MADTSSGRVSLDVVPDFSSFGNVFSQGIRSTLNQAEGLGKQLSSVMGSGLQTGVIAGTAAAGIAIGDFVSKGVAEFVQLGEQTRKLEELTGASAQQASLFAGVIKDLGGNVEGTSRGLGIFAANIAKEPGLFREYGVEIQKTKQGNVDVLGTLDNLRAAFQGTTENTQRDIVAKTLLGKSYQQLIPYMSLTNDQLKTFQDLARGGGQVLSQDDVDKARELKIQMQELSDNVEKLKLSAGRQGAGLLNNILGNVNTDPLRVLGDLTQALSGDPAGGLHDIATAHGAAAAAAHKQAAAELDAKDAMAQVGIQAQQTATSLKSIASAGEGVRTAEESVASANDAVTKASQAVTKAQEGEANAAYGVTKAQEGVQHAAEGVQRAQQNQATAQQALNDLLAQGAVNADQVASAQKALDSANQTVTTSTQQLAQAQENLNELQQFGAIDSAHELTDAHLALAQATIQLSDARLQAARAVPTLNDPLAAQKAQLSIQQAQEAQAKAQENVNKLSQFGTQSDKQLAAAQQQVRDDTQKVTDSLLAQADAQHKLNEAQAGDPQFAQKVAAAKQQVADAALGVRDAEQSEQDAVHSLQQARQSQVDAHRSVIDAEDGVTQAKQRASDATIALRDAHYGLDDAIQKAVDNVDNLAPLVDSLTAKYPELVGILQPLIDLAKAAPGTTTGIPDQSSAETAAYIPPAHRASGGPVIPGLTYKINEQGGETVTFPAPGVVHPANLTPVGSDGATITNHVTVIVNGADLTDATDRRRIADRLVGDIYASMSNYRRGRNGMRS